MKQNLVTLLLFAISLSGCVGTQIDSAISKYEAVADQVELGDSKEEVLAILKPTQESVPISSRKYPEKYIKDGIFDQLN